MGTLNTACRRILEAKYKLGLFDNPYKYCDVNRPKRDIFTKEHYDGSISFAARGGAQYWQYMGRRVSLLGGNPEWETINTLSLIHISLPFTAGLRTTKKWLGIRKTWLSGWQPTRTALCTCSLPTSLNGDTRPSLPATNLKRRTSFLLRRRKTVICGCWYPST